MSATTLRVAEAQARDANRGIVRVDSRVMRELGLTSGDAIEIAGTAGRIPEPRRLRRPRRSASRLQAGVRRATRGQWQQAAGILVLALGHPHDEAVELGRHLDLAR